MSRPIDGGFKYIIIDDDKSIKGYIKTLPPLPHDESSLIKVFENPDFEEFKMLRFSEIKGKIIHFGMKHIYEHVANKSFFIC